MKTFDMVNLPEEESLARLWLRMSILDALVSESGLIVFRDANETESNEFRNEFKPGNGDDFEAVTRAGVFVSAPETFRLDGINFDESTDNDLVFAVSLTELKQILLELCHTQSSGIDEKPLAFQIGLPGRSLEASVTTNAGADPDYITIECPEYAFTHDDFDSVHFSRGNSEYCYQMSFPFNAEKVCYEYISQAEYERRSQSLSRKLGRFVGSLFKRKNPTDASSLS